MEDAGKKNILILVPHPDDEIVACMAALRRAQQTGACVFALYLTHGCLARHTLWPWQRKNYEKYVERRRKESEEVAAYLSITSLGRSMRAARHLWCDLPIVFDEICQVLKRHPIDEVWVPAYEGGNADHDALNAVGTILSKRVKVIEFAEYNYNHGTKSSQKFLFVNGSESDLYLTSEEQKTKRFALDLYQSEKINLNYVDIKRESHRPLVCYDYSVPAHKGILWYQRFQWVPFRHPRVDFTDPQQVSNAILEFMATQA